MKIKFKVVDPKTQKVHKLITSGKSMKACERVLAGRLILMGVSQPKSDQVHFQIMKG